MCVGCLPQLLHLRVTPWPWLKVLFDRDWRCWTSTSRSQRFACHWRDMPYKATSGVQRVMLNEKATIRCIDQSEAQRPQRCALHNYYLSFDTTPNPNINFFDNRNHGYEQYDACSTHEGYASKLVFGQLEKRVVEKMSVVSTMKKMPPSYCIIK